MIQDKDDSAKMKSIQIMESIEKALWFIFYAICGLIGVILGSSISGALR